MVLAGLGNRTHTRTRMHTHAHINPQTILLLCGQMGVDVGRVDFSARERLVRFNAVVFLSAD